MPLQATSGAASYDAFGGGVPSEPNYIESVFSTYLYTGNGSTQTITNGIDLAGEGGLVWMKNRNLVRNHNLYDTARGAYKQLRSDSTGAQITNASGYGLTAFNADGFSLGTDIDGENYGNVVSWTFRKQPKFFDVVTWTGNGASNRLITHALGAIPAVIMIKATSTTGSWYVSIRDNGLNGDTTDFANAGLGLESTSAKDSSFLGTSQAIPWTSTQFTLYATGARTNVNGVTYVAYLFAHNAGGFGLTGTDNVISCGSWTSAGSTPVSVNLGYEPQWILWKRTNSTGGNWYLNDNMRGMPVQNGAGTGCKFLYPNLSDAEYGDYGMDPTSTGFNAISGASGNTFIYIAIRRGPMKVPTSGTSVFTPLSRAGTSSLTTISSGSVGVVDTIMAMSRDVANGMRAWDRLRGVTNWLGTYTTQAETAASGSVVGFDSMTGVRVNDGTNEVINTNSIASPYINYMFKRAPSFFDEVCYTGTGANRTVTHNLGVVPEMMIVKQRSAARDWVVYIAPMGNNYFACLNDGTFQGSSSTMWNDTTPTASVFTVGTNLRTNVSAGTYVAYLFATCAGVSKVGSYTGTGTTLQVNCGFTGGARFVLIKRTDSTGDWYVWDTARGIVSGNDPYLLLNSTAAEVTSTDYIDTYSAGFEISSTAPAAINASGGTFIFLAIA